MKTTINLSQLIAIDKFIFSEQYTQILSLQYISLKVYFFVGPSTQCSAVQRVRLNKVDVVMLYYVMSELFLMSYM